MKTHSLKVKANVCELFIGAGKQLREIRDITGLPLQSVSNIIKQYFAKPDQSMVLLSNATKEYDKQYIIKNWDILPIRQIALDLDLTERQINTRSKRYGLPPKRLCYDVNSVKRDYMNNIILDFETGIFYHNAVDLSRAINRSKSTVGHWISGARTNPTKRYFPV